MDGVSSANLEHVEAILSARDYWLQCLHLGEVSSHGRPETKTGTESEAIASAVIMCFCPDICLLNFVGVFTHPILVKKCITKEAFS